jgi:cobalt/nickel transport system permease protein
VPFEIIPDYSIPLLGATPLSTILAGTVGVLVVLGLVFLAGRSLQGKSQTVNPKS